MHKLRIPFPVSADAAIYYKEGRQIDRREMKVNERELKTLDKNERRYIENKMKKQINMK